MDPFQPFRSSDAPTSSKAIQCANDFANELRIFFKIYSEKNDIF